MWPWKRKEEDGTGQNARGGTRPPATGRPPPHPESKHAPPGLVGVVVSSPSSSASAPAPAPIPAHTRRSTVNGSALIGDDVEVLPPPSPGQPPPPFLRGTIKQLYLLKQAAEGAVTAAAGRVARRYGFCTLPQAGVDCAVRGLVADLCGLGGVMTLDDAVAQLHEDNFENYNRWARMVGGTAVYSITHDPNRDALVTAGAAAAAAVAQAAAAGDSLHAGTVGPDAVVLEGGGVEAASVAGGGQGAGLSPDSTGGSDTSPAAAGGSGGKSADHTGLAVARGLKSALPGSDTVTRLNDLVLLYCIRAEMANLRFMPELTAWLFHQMRAGYLAPPEEEVGRPCEDPEAGFFYRTTVLPLYSLLKRAGKREWDAKPDWAAALLCCMKSGKKRAVKNSARPNYDDLNEMFWQPHMLQVTWHTEHPDKGVHTITAIPKTFREKSSYIAIVLSFWRWFAFLVILFHALLVVSNDIVDAGGTNLLGIVNINPMGTLVRLTMCFQTLALTQVAHVLAAACHATPFGDHCWTGRPHCTSTAWMKGGWAFGWAVALVVIANSGALMGVDLFGGPVWLLLCLARLICIVISEGLFTPCGCTRTHPLRRVVMAMERVYFASPPLTGPDNVLGWKHMRQPTSRVVGYTMFWALILAVKVVLDLHILTQQAELVATVEATALAYNWQLSVFGYRHAIIVFGSWMGIGAMYALDSYILFILAASVMGYCTLRRDGVGFVQSQGDVNQSFVRGLGWSRPTPLADQFVQRLIPIAQQRGVDANVVFRRPWDQFVMSLREQDLISNEEQCRLMYGDSVLGVSNTLPLFLYAGKVQDLILRAHKVAQLAFTTTSDEDFRSVAAGDDVTEEAVLEVARALPPILTAVCCSHSAIGHHDPHVANTLHALFNVQGDQTLRDWVGGVLSAEGNAVETSRGVAGLVARLVVEFEKESANTRLLGSPLLQVTVQLLTKMDNLLHPAAAGAHGEGDAGGRVGGAGRGATVVDPSFAGPTLDRLATLAVHATTFSVMDGGGLPTSARHGRLASAAVPAHTASASNVVDTRSVRGIITLLQTPNEGSGRLDGDGEFALRERCESLREAARRVFYLLTMSSADGSLKVGEAQRRLNFFINSLYMNQMPSITSVLDMPAFNVVTPHYHEAVVFGKHDFLTAVNRHGVSAMVYLKSLHAEEWSNFCERLGVKNESEAWHASRDAQGNNISGEMEVRLWASHRGQTLARTIHGVMEYARAIRLLAMTQLELEYAALEDAKPAAERLSPLQVEMDAAQAAQWFTAERFQYLCACQRYAEHGEEDVRRRADLDYLLMLHPLLSIVYFDASVSEVTAKKRLTSVYRTSRGVGGRILLPGNPILDGIGEGKPENQMNALTFATGSILQVLDMNQDGYLEEALKLPAALAYMNRVGSAGRPLVVAGLREHVFTHSLSSSAFFMSQQEYLFGTMWQRIMASPLRVRMHYGHPDIFRRVFMLTRGGMAKASSIINVSEDIFAGYTAMLRGGESGHIEFMQMGKGRDVGVLQIEVFESKIAGGTAMSMTSRDSFRVYEGMDFARLLSFFHTSSGFFLAQLVTVVAYLSTLYYMAAMALTQLDAAVLASNQVYLLGEVNALQWFVQLGLLTIVPLWTLYALDGGFVRSTWRTVRNLLRCSPIFFMFQIQTKAYHFDAALCFGRAGYQSTGRDFVLRHVSFEEVFRCTAHSHLYLGMEALLLLVLSTAYGTFQSVTAHLFFLVTGWLFTVSLLLGAFWFNPFALEFKFVKQDAAEWWKWLVRRGGPDSWEVWYEKETGSQYSQANVGARAWRLVRLSRLLLPAALLVYRTGPADPVRLGMMTGIAFATILAYQVVHWVTAVCTQSAEAEGNGSPTAGCCTVHHPIRRTMQTAAYIVPIAGVFVVNGVASPDALTGAHGVELILAYFVLLWWASRVCNIVSMRLVADGVRAVHKVFDAQIGAVLLAIQLLFSIAMPLGSVLHTSLLFSSDYADTVEVITGSRDMLNRHSKGAGTKFLKLKHLGELEFRRNHRHNASGPENRIGIRRLRLRRVDEEGGVTPLTGAGGGAGLGGVSGGGAAPPAMTSQLPEAGLGVGSTIRIPGLDLDDDTPAPPPAPPPGAGDGTAGDGAAAELANGAPTNATAPGPDRPRKSLKEIMQQYAKPAMAPATTAAPTSAVGGAGGGEGGAGTSGKGKGGTSGDGGNVKVSSGLAALRARFERKG